MTSHDFRPDDAGGVVPGDALLGLIIALVTVILVLGLVVFV
jgi:hypothetical protein